MQQRPTIAALRQLADDEENDQSKACINKTTDFMGHCSTIFEYGMLSNYTIRQENQHVLDSILQAQKYFEDGLSHILQTDPDFKAGHSTQQTFMAWQTWDLQRIIIFGFKEFAIDFFNKYGDNFFISPKRFNGSAIETLFSQFKHITGAKLSAVNYAQARAAYLMKVDIHGRRYGEEHYRNVSLYLRQQQLQGN